MPERIYKLQPDRTLSLRGFNTFAAAASIHNATPTGFEVSGTFRDPADFAVAVLYDADNFFEHPLIKYLPDFNFAGLTLSFSLHYTDGVQPIDSPKFNWVDWATLDVIRYDGTSPAGTTANPWVYLWDNAMLADAAFPAASATVNVVSGSSPQLGDRLTLWYENIPFDFTVSAGLGGSVSYEWQDAGTFASISVGSVTYPYSVTTAGGEDGPTIAQGVYNAAVNDPLVLFTVSGAVLSFTSKVNTGTTVTVGSYYLWLVTGSPLPFIAENIAAQINDYYWPGANTTFGLLAAVNDTEIGITAARYGYINVTGTSVSWVSGTKFSGITAGSTFIIAGISYSVAHIQSPTLLTLNPVPAAPEAANALYLAPRGGRDGNMIQLYTLATSPSTLSFDNAQIPLTGGSSAVTWNISLDFTALGIDSIRQCWLTFAPSLANGAAYTASEWQATFSNWQLTEADAIPGVVTDTVKTLQVAGPGSIRIEEDDSACTFFTPVTAKNPDGTQAQWARQQGFYSKYFASVAKFVNQSVTVTYTCQFTHYLYIGTSLDGSPTPGGAAVVVENTHYNPSLNGNLYSDRGIAGIRLDGDTETFLDCRVNTNGSELVARRLLRPTSVPAGTHTVVIRVQQAGAVYFDFLEAAVLSDVPDATVPLPSMPGGAGGPVGHAQAVSPALDFDTDHTYKLPPARLMWIMNKLGYGGPMNEYLGVFWWNQRTPLGGSYSTVQITFAGTFDYKDSIVLSFGAPPTPLGKYVYPSDSLATIASHFAAYINSSLVGLWASATGAVLTVTGRSPAPAYTVAVTYQITPALRADGTSTVTNGTVTINPATPAPGVYSEWIVDDAATPPINRAVRDWHADFYAQCAAANLPVVTSCSMELVNPPDGYVARFPNGDAVLTATGFASLTSSQCAPGSAKLLTYQKAVYRNIAQMQLTAGLTPSVQYGEFLWWFDPNGQPVVSATNNSPISIQTATAHGLTTGQMVVIAGVLGNTAANGTWTVTVTDPTHFALNGSSANGDYTKGGTIIGGMGYYDAETAAAAQSALGRPLYTFMTANDDPAVNGGADALFLRNRLRDHVTALETDIRHWFPTVKCELLWPYDVNYPTPVGGGAGQLNRFVNLPVEWQQQSTSGLDTIKVEALAFSTGLRDLNLARQAIELFPSFGWPLAALRYLVPVFGVATPWERELALVWGAGLPFANLWALDHVCLYNLDVPEGYLERRSIVKAA